jgi:hypothetical protein
MDPTVSRKYPVILIGMALVLSACVAVFNYVADPYVLFGFAEADSSRLSRIDQFNHMRITKPWYMRQVKATAVVVGSSRSARVHPEHPAWASEVGYNLAAPGMTIQENLRFIQHAHAIQPLSKVMIGLDYEAYIRPAPDTRKGFVDLRMARGQDDLRSFSSRGQYVRDLADSLFSMQALSLSVAAATGISPPGRRYFKDGTWEITTTSLTGRGGYVYIGKNVLLAHQNNTLDTSKNLATLREILRFCHNNNVQTRLFFTPTHVFFVDLWHRLGYESMWLDFHRQVVLANDKVADELGREPFPLWGFSQVEGVVNEPIYRRKDAAKGWYDDGVHTRVPLGNKMMNSVWGEKAEIGLQVSADNIEAYLAETLQLMDKFNAATPELVKKLHHDIGLD